MISKLFKSVSVFLLLRLTICYEKNLRQSCDYNSSPLLLTPLVKCGKISLAREEARVQNWTFVESYSGFFTVNITYNSNLYFWFFPALIDPDNAPVILWLQGGPGNAVFFGIFSEHGPFTFDDDEPETIHSRIQPWTETHSVIYMDNPVGAGFSYTENNNGYAQNMDDVSRDLYEALVQFFTMFPEFRKQNFFIGGQSYAGKYVPAIANHIHKIQERDQHWDSGVTINLRGIFLGSPLVDPRTQLRYADFLYNIGLIDEHQKEVIQLGDDALAALIDQQNWIDAYWKFMEIMLGGISSYVYKVSGFLFKFNLLEPWAPYYSNGDETIATEWFRKAIHVGNASHGHDGSVGLYLREDLPKSTKHLVEKLLNANYRVLIYAGQLDVVIPAVSIEHLINAMQWTRKQKYLSADRKVWRVGNDIAGYVKEADNLYHVLIRKAGHNAPNEQPAWCFDMINRFTRGKHF